MKITKLSFKNKSKIGVLVIHGFTGNPTSLAYYSEKLSKAGFNVETPLLPGHGTKWQDLNKVKNSDWITEVENCLKILKKRADKIFAVGLSMGGTLACYLAEVHPELLGVILINPAIRLYGEWRFLFLPILMHFIPFQQGDPVFSRGDIKDPKETEDHYDKDPLKGVWEFVKLNRMTEKNLYKINQPVIFFQSTEDHVIPTFVSSLIQKKISSKYKKINFMSNSYHVSTQDFQKDEIVKKSVEFIKNFSKPAGKK
jgi:carboxylesterase